MHRQQSYARARTLVPLLECTEMMLEGEINGTDVSNRKFCVKKQSDLKNLAAKDLHLVLRQKATLRGL
jgi:hypothetical protein